MPENEIFFQDLGIRSRLWRDYPQEYIEVFRRLKFSYDAEIGKNISFSDSLLECLVAIQNQGHRPIVDKIDIHHLLKYAGCHL